ncbi:hypothetical protein FHX82_005737 [Amycolatopsis bartoniae]|uniref:DUF2255 family protein n=1 Tax=Amycolatopsis bartoniae TaxID=941986 RepID=A0A8H9IYF9_9PSEU|nr:DUF2255 family protein [Amycolatopsis bartoniae]MBB2938659.1 hypothetical protein [Amycolatopsis bartoniae]TVT08849.1 DUF2255 family protein [Amycolatopsis bartoniae]GHF83901.1 hypothetical protein GCM10017566_67490 [Amycolatopsis bartoniae]
MTARNPALAAARDDDELTIASRRADGSLRPARIVWAVEHDGALYVRSVNGPDAAWYRGTRTRHEGQVTAGGHSADVTFVDAADDTALNDAIDRAYRTKYRRYAANILDHITSPRARATTIRLVPAQSTKD